MNAYRLFCRLTRIAMTFAAVAAVAFQANASTAATSRLASGRWVKIKLTGRRVRQISLSTSYANGDSPTRQKSAYSASPP